MSAIDAGPTALGLSWRGALRHAAATLWLPTLVPVVTGMLRDCGHCLGSYLLSLPMVPGALVPALCRCDGAWFFVVGGTATLLLFVALLLLLRELPRRLGWVAQAIAAGLVLFEAIGFAMALRA
ncbi:MAG: hypothetical protein JNL12_22695 [Planctomycetes bacterium]|nr:hypothetical protein [Planctomycetota bacterium]